MTKLMHFDSVCPFLMCLETGPHSHEICPKCGAVWYGNIYCDECMNHADERLESWERKRLRYIG